MLVRHPPGDLLIDTGLGRRIAEQMREFPFLFRLGAASSSELPKFALIVVMIGLKPNHDDAS